jgi:CRISPR-associated protein (TIGR03986 family)
MMPKHISDVPEDRKAIAPYNFVQLPTKIVTVPLPSPQTKYEGHTGYLTCTLTTESPLYIRCGHTLREFEQELESRKLSNFFYYPSNPKNPVLPGSSLRGMLRTLLEIVSFSRITQVSDAQKFFFRAVASMRDDPLTEPYKKRLSKDTIKAGYLLKQGEKWFIRPAQTIDNRYPFVWISENIVTSVLHTFIPMIQGHYLPQQISNISFEDIDQKNTRPFAKKISQNLHTYLYKGVLVSSGNMLESGQNSRDLKRKNHCLVGQPNDHVNPLPISDNAIASYRSALTKFQKESFDEEYGALENGRCIFYCQPRDGQEVSFFGHCPNFRVPYQIEGQPLAATALNYLPKKLRDPLINDFATVLFGFVHLEKTGDNQLQSLKGRLSLTDAVCKTDGDVWYEKQPIAPQLLEAPKPSTFQHYLVQPIAEKIELKHYGSQSVTETVIRGHKLYWHKGKQLDIKHPNPEDVQEAYKTTINPIRPRVEFEFKIYFENLSNEELGAVLWVLNLAQDNRYRLSLGMGKPLGMGAVKITHHLVLSNRKQRYGLLFENKNWALAESQNENTSTYTQSFEKFILDEIDPHRKSFQKLEDMRRIKMLLAMLTWEENPDKAFLAQTRYMEIERDANKPFIGQKVKDTDTTVNEYRDRLVLPTPLQVRGLEGNSNSPFGGGRSNSAIDPLKRGERPSSSTNNGNIKSGKTSPIKKKKS